MFRLDYPPAARLPINITYDPKDPFHPLCLSSKAGYFDIGGFHPGPVMSHPWTPELCFAVVNVNGSVDQKRRQMKEATQHFLPALFPDPNVLQVYTGGSKHRLRSYNEMQDHYYTKAIMFGPPNKMFALVCDCVDGPMSVTEEQRRQDASQVGPCIPSV